MVSVLLLGGFVVLLGLVGVSLRGRTRRAGAPAPVARARSTAAVRVLRDEDELAAALLRAARSERDAAEHLHRRAAAYEARVAPSPITELRPRRLARTAGDEQPRPPA